MHRTFFKIHYKRPFVNKRLSRKKYHLTETNGKQDYYAAYNVFNSQDV